MQSFLIGVVALLFVSAPGVAQTPPADAPALERYRSATLDEDGHLAIVTSDGRTIVVRKEGEQTAFGTPIVSPDGTAVGAQALFANCCTSYDIPLQLVVYAQGKLHRMKGIGLAIFAWGFSDGGSRVAFGEQTVHFGCQVHYELRDIGSERVIESADVPQACGQIPRPRRVKIPSWVAGLRTSKD